MRDYRDSADLDPDEYVWIDGKLHYIVEQEEIDDWNQFNRELEQMRESFQVRADYLEKRLTFFKCYSCGKKMERKHPLCSKCSKDFLINDIEETIGHYEHEYNENKNFFEKYAPHFNYIDSVNLPPYLYFWFSYVARIKTPQETRWLLLDYNSSTPLKELILPNI